MKEIDLAPLDTRQCHATSRFSRSAASTEVPALYPPLTGHSPTASLVASLVEAVAVHATSSQVHEFPSSMSFQARSLSPSLKWFCDQLPRVLDPPRCGGIEDATGLHLIR